MNAKIIIEELEKHTSQSRKESNEWFFKTGKGEYGEGDKFIGVSMPNIRKVIKNHLSISYPEIEKLLNSPIHEVRMAGVLILTENAKKAHNKHNTAKQKEIADFYLKNRKGINNWDLVDVSCHYIVGNAIINNAYEISVLDELSSSASLWDRRISMVSTFAFIRTGNVFPTIVLAKKLLDSKEDLMHKAIGWMLRESWKREPAIIENFLLEHYHRLPRTTLRYAIEKMEETKRKEFLYMK